LSKRLLEELAHYHYWRAQRQGKAGHDSPLLFLAELAQMLKTGELELPDSQLDKAATRARWFSLLYAKPWILYAKATALPS
jgi:hypothetical protein